MFLAVIHDKQRCFVCNNQFLIDEFFFCCILVLLRITFSIQTRTDLCAIDTYIIKSMGILSSFLRNRYVLMQSLYLMQLLKKIFFLPNN